MKQLFTIVLLLVHFLLGSAPAEAVTVPPRPTSSIYCQDYANVISQENRQKINSYSRKLAKATKAQLVVVTISTLNGESLEDYSLELLRSWGIGDSKENNGVLLLVAVKDRKSRIEVGYGLEGALPDGKTGRIQDEQMIPYFRQGKYASGILHGYAALYKEIRNEYKLGNGKFPPPPAKSAKAPATNSATDKGLFNDLGDFLTYGLTALIIIALLLIDWFFLGGFITSILLSSIFHGGRGGGDSFGGGSGGGGGSSRDW